MTNHPRRASRRTRKDERRLARRVTVWVDRYTDAALTPWQRDLLERSATTWGRGTARRKDRVVAVGVDIARDGDDTVTVATMTGGGQLYVAPLGTEPADPYAWKTVGWTNEPLDLKAIIDDKDDDVRALASVTNLAHRTITVPFTPTPQVVRAFHGFGRKVSGRPWVDGLHPDDVLEWEAVVEGRGPDGVPLLVCDACGEPAPCTERVLRHMDTDMHHTYCIPTGFCVIAEKRISELPAR